jgi:hypothetical protein
MVSGHWKCSHHLLRHHDIDRDASGFSWLGYRTWGLGVELGPRGEPPTFLIGSDDLDCERTMARRDAGHGDWLRAQLTVGRQRGGAKRRGDSQHIETPAAKSG